MGDFVKKVELKTLYSFNERLLYEEFVKEEVLMHVFKGHAQKIAAANEVIKLS